MILYEHQAKEFLHEYGIQTPGGYLVQGPGELRPLEYTAVLKAQVLSGGRGKAGGVLKASNDAEAGAALKKLVSSRVSGLPVKKVLVEKFLSIDREFYLALALDRDRGCTVLMVSGKGGVDVEETVDESSLHRFYLHPLLRLREFQVRDMTFRLGLERGLAPKFACVVNALTRLYYDLDATLAEINPLGLCGEEFIAADGKIIIDDNALFRHPELMKVAGSAIEDPLEERAHREGLAYVRLGGNIGIIGNGAGLVMGTIDVISREGGKPANFLDIGGGASAGVVKKSLQIVLADRAVRGVFINIFGGITRCDEVARGIVQTIEEVGINVPLVIKLVGTHADEGREILERAHLNPVASIKEGARKIVELVRAAGGEE